MTIVIVEYNAGNLFSVKAAMDRIGVPALISGNPEIIKNAEKVIFPGVGEMGSAIRYLQQHQLYDVIRNLSQPVLGICLGLQLFCRHSEENDTMGMSVFDTDVKRFPPQNKVPHMGWNEVYHNGDPLFAGIRSGEYFYFVHSYYAGIADETMARTDYIVPFSAALRRANIYAVQFHPEKSGLAGEQLLKNFINLGVETENE